MNISEIKKILNEKYVTKSGKLNANLIRKDRVDIDFIDVIINTTHFLDKINPTLPQRIWHILNDYLEIKKCTGDNLLIFKVFTTGYTKCCSNKKCICNEKSKELRKETNLLKYGTICPIQNSIVNSKSKKTMIEKYGVEYPIQNLQIKINTENTNLKKYGYKNALSNKDIRNKALKTLEIRYGVDNPLKSLVIKNRVKQTNLNRYGVNNPAKNKNIQDKQRKTVNEKYGVDNVFMEGYIRDNIKETILDRYGNEYFLHTNTYKDTMLSNYGVEHSKHIHIKDILQLLESQEYWNTFSSYLEIVKTFNTKLAKSTIINYAKKYRSDLYVVEDKISYPHKIINEFLDSLGVEYVINTRKIISPLELDIYIPTKNLAIEINGVYWHTEEKGKNSTYHLNKLEKCEEKGIDLIHLTDIDILTKKVIVFNLIKERLELNKEININECSVIDLDKDTTINFIKENSLFEYKESIVHKGLLYNNEIVSIVCLKEINNTFEITNYTTKLGYSVSDLLYILKEIEGNFIVNVDRNMFNKNIFEENNWKLKEVIEPECVYIKNNTLYSR